MRKIALEEHFLTDEMGPYIENTLSGVGKDLAARSMTALKDFGSARLDAMDAAGVATAVLGLAGPGVQAEPDAARAVALARRCNDQLAAAVARRPDRYAGFAHLPMQDAGAAVAELIRCVRELGFRGAMINGQTGGIYLDDPRYEAFWAAVAELGAPIYLHPAFPTVEPVVLQGRDVLAAAMWGWTMETAAHALRLVVGGVFERHPQAQLILGHMGECLPFHLWRFDSRYGVVRHDAHALPHLPSHYVRRNIAITTAGVCDDAALRCSLEALGTDRVMFSIDYPFERSAEAGAWADALPLDDAVKAKVCHGNAEALLRLQGN